MPVSKKRNTHKKHRDKILRDRQQDLIRMNAWMIQNVLLAMPKFAQGYFEKLMVIQRDSKKELLRIKLMIKIFRIQLRFAVNPDGTARNVAVYKRGKFLCSYKPPEGDI